MQATARSPSAYKDIPLPPPPPPPPNINDSDPSPRTESPVGSGQEPLNILILGGSYAGLSCAHFFLDRTIEQLRQTNPASCYRVVLVSPSTHLYWNIAAPRALVSSSLLKPEQIFLPIEEGFHRHRGRGLAIIQGAAVAWDPRARTVMVELIGKTAEERASLVTGKKASQSRQQNGTANPPAKVQSFSYHALIVATGSSAADETLSLHGPHLHTIGALNAYHARIRAAATIVVCGGGCSGVETAGQLATYLNYESHFPLRRRLTPSKRIILISGRPGLLGEHSSAKTAAKAEKMLSKLKVEVHHDVRVVAAKEAAGVPSQTEVMLSDGSTIVADMYIACTGVTPNSAFVPQHLKDERGYIRTDCATLRPAPEAGERVYAIGDVASYSHNYIRDVYAAVPVVMKHLLHDLLAFECRLAKPHGGDEHRTDELKDEAYEFEKGGQSRLLPISRFSGVGMIKGHRIPGWIVHWLKGYDYRTHKGATVVSDGGNPYAAKAGSWE